MFAYKDETMQVRFEGPIKLFNGYKDFNITSSALGQGNMETNEIKMNSFLMVDTNVPTAAFDIIARQIQEVIKSEGANEGIGDHTELLYKIADIVGERTVKDYEQREFAGICTARKYSSAGQATGVLECKSEMASETQSILQ